MRRWERGLGDDVNFNDSDDDWSKRDRHRRCEARFYHLSHNQIPSISNDDPGNPLQRGLVLDFSEPVMVLQPLLLF